MNSQNYVKTIYNKPYIEQRADPYIYKHKDGNYYFTASVPEYDRIILRRANSLDGLIEAKEKIIWKKHERGIMSTHIWAPELHYIDNTWIIYYAAGDKDDIWAIRPYVLMCKDEDPIDGTWVELGKMKGADDFSFQDFSLDMTVFEHNEKWYCIWAEKVSVGKKISNIYIAELESPNQLKSQQVLLSFPDYDWERIGFWVNEGPAILKHNGKIYMTYSASETGAYYCIGMLSIDEKADVLDPKMWNKEKEAVLNTNIEKGLIGPGHNCFVKSEDGEEDIMVYHARQYDEIEGDPLYDPNRHTYKMRVQWDSNDNPRFLFDNNY
ncbi:family 43 glycosylhydrolase [Konateibacter massiliensis]|uniref:family 43 glycosylhydrolase n=1 Tax=Konateibacter massiliensis TaxID=2002841 RepID=UPI000C1489C9|nr:family 43 glycosylhydrolase [Konateibacter massiliensis]